jgi:hypothetical protein
MSCVSFRLDDAWVGLDSGYEPLFLLDSKEGKLMVRDNRKKNAHRERYVTVANGFLVIYTDETKERTLRVLLLATRTTAHAHTTPHARLHKHTWLIGGLNVVCRSSRWRGWR